jgi:hypothetical protein
VKHWPDRDTATIMVAIAGAETNWTDEPGDPLAVFPDDQRAEYEPYSCEEFTSWGAWQINYRWNAGAIQALCGLKDPCEVSRWLLDIENNARAAYDVWERQGFRAWSTYNLGRYFRYMAVASSAVDVALAASSPPLPDPSSVDVPPPVSPGGGVTPDLVNLLGYLQSDVARAIRDPLEQLRQRLHATVNQQLVDTALAAVNTLESSGK